MKKTLYRESNTQYLVTKTNQGQPSLNLSESTASVMLHSIDSAHNTVAWIPRS